MALSLSKGWLGFGGGQSGGEPVLTVSLWFLLCCKGRSSLVAGPEGADHDA